LRKLSRVVQQSPNSVIITDPEGRIEYVNPACSRLTGYPPADLLGQNPRLLKSGENPPTLYQQMWSTLKAGQEWHGELCNRKKNGELFWESAVLSPLRDADGQITHFIGIKVDITQRKRAEEELRTSRARLQLQFDHLPIGCITWSLDCRVTAWNPGAERIFGFPAEEILGREPYDLIVPRWAQPQLRKTWDRLLAGDDVGANSLNDNLTKDGRTINCEWANTPLRGPHGAVIGVLSMVQDVTEKRSLEKQLLRAQRLESIGTLAAGIAHDLNNILAPILMSAQLLEDNHQGQEERELLATIQGSAHRGADIVKQVLTFARGAEGQRLTLQPRHLLREIGKIAREIFPKDIAFSLHAVKDLWSITGDPTQLHQVLMNLCVNARDAMPEGGKLLVSAENIHITEPNAGLFADGQPGPHVLIQVSDTGQGIPADIIEKIFDPFFTTKEQGKGTGLGLSTVLGIVRGHRGFLDVQTEPGRGSTFKIYLPAQPGQAAAAPAAGPLAAPKGAGERILVVDDEAHLRAVTERLLTKHGYEVLSASNGREALDLLFSHDNCKAVVTDILMPVMDGVALAQALKESYPLLPVIACTGWG